MGGACAVRISHANGCFCHSSQFDDGTDYLLGALEARQHSGSERSTSPFSLRDVSAIVQNNGNSPTKLGVIRRPAPLDSDARDAWANVTTPVASEPQSPQTSSPLAPEKASSSSSTETLVFQGSDSPYSSPTLSSVTDELKERQRASEKPLGDAQWSFFKHGLDIPRSLGNSDTEDDVESDKTTAETA